MNIEVNYLGILLAGIASMVVGFIWYSPVMFAKEWSKLMGHKMEDMKAMQKKMGPMYALSFVLALVMAYLLNHVIVLSQTFYHQNMLFAGIGSAFWMWFGFIMPVQATDVIFGGKKWALFAINTGYQLVSIVVMGIIIGLL
jgi:hypothetical protein